MAQLNKQKIRQQMLAQLRTQPESLRQEKSEKILKRVIGLEKFQSAQWLFSYVSLEYEVNTYPLIDHAQQLGKKMAVPVIFNKEKKRGRFVISEVWDRFLEFEIGPFRIQQPKSQFIRPVEPKKIEIAMIPCVAFDKKGRRLGHGKGFFDRFLGELSVGCLKVGIGFDFQLVSELPQEPHDLPLDLIVTDRQIVHSL